MDLRRTLTQAARRFFNQAARDEFCLEGIRAGDEDEAVVVGGLHVTVSNECIG
jgi:hypothetical protein